MFVASMRPAQNARDNPPLPNALIAMSKNAVLRVPAKASTDATLLDVREIVKRKYYSKLSRSYVITSSAQRITIFSMFG